MVESPKYRDSLGLVVTVFQSFNGKWMSGRPSKSGRGHRRVKSKMLPPRSSASAAQVDLDGYASVHGWRRWHPEMD